MFVDICNYLNVTPDYLMLGNMRGNRASIDIIDELKMCSSEEIATVKKIVDAFVSIINICSNYIQILQLWRN